VSSAASGRSTTTRSYACAAPIRMRAWSASPAVSVARCPRSSVTCGGSGTSPQP